MKKRSVEKKTRRLGWRDANDIAQTTRRVILVEVQALAKKIAKEKDGDKTVLLCEELRPWLTALGNAESALRFMRELEGARIPRG